MKRIKIFNFDIAKPILVHYNLFYIHGKIKTENTTNDLTEFIWCNNGIESHKWPTFGGEFKCFCYLKKGLNILNLKADNDGENLLTFIAEYDESKSKRYVQPVYIVCKNSDGSFLSPINENNTLEHALIKLKFNCRLIQTYFAESLFEHNLTRKVFEYKEDDKGEPHVEIFYSELDIEETKTMSGDDLYAYFHQELETKLNYGENCKYLVFMSCTRYYPPANTAEFDKTKIMTEYVKGHTALGGGNMALFGTGSLHTWSSNIMELNECFTNQNRIDYLEMFDDSCGRGTYWANYSTTLGAVIHELGHCFDLAHTSHGIMSRGHDDMNCFYTVTEKFEGSYDDIRGSENDTCLRNGNANNKRKYNGAHWCRPSAIILHNNKWFNKENSISSSISMSLHPNLLGPVGNQGTSVQSNQLRFNSSDWLKSNQLKLSSISLYFDEYLYGIQFSGVKQEIERGESVCLGDEVNSKIFGTKPDNVKTYKLQCNNPNEVINKILIRAGAWIDGIQILTNQKSTLWMGGHGGRLMEFHVPRDQFISTWLVTGETYVGSITMVLKDKHLSQITHFDGISNNSLMEDSRLLQIASEDESIKVTNCRPETPSSKTDSANKRAKSSHGIENEILISTLKTSLEQNQLTNSQTNNVLNNEVHHKEFSSIAFSSPELQHHEVKDKRSPGIEVGLMADNFVSFTSEQGIVLLELRKSDGEIYYYKEYSGEYIQSEIKIQWNKITYSKEDFDSFTGAVYNRTGDKYEFCLIKKELESFKIML